MELSDSTVQYGLTSGYGSTVSNGGFVFAHSLSLVGLSEATLYNYRVCSRDTVGNQGCSANATFSTTDDTPPVISGVTVSAITGSGATFNWTTNENATSVVEYGLLAGPPYGFTNTNPVMVTSHSVSIVGLSSNTLYNYACVLQMPRAMSHLP